MGIREAVGRYSLPGSHCVAIICPAAQLMFAATGDARFAERLRTMVGELAAYRRRRRIPACSVRFPKGHRSSRISSPPRKSERRACTRFTRFSWACWTRIRLPGSARRGMLLPGLPIGPSWVTRLLSDTQIRGHAGYRAWRHERIVRRSLFADRNRGISSSGTALLAQGAAPALCRDREIILTACMRTHRCRKRSAFSV